MKQTHRQNMERDCGTDRLSEKGRGSRCDRAAEWELLLYDFAEGLTDEKTGQEVQRHLAECAYCRGALEDIRWMTSALRTSVPEPKTDLSARVMDTIREDEESGGRIVAQAIDVRTGRVLAAPTEPHGTHRLIRIVSGIAAVFLLVIGLIYVVPLLRTGSGAASGTQDILGEMQSGEGDRFSGGVFIGDIPQTTEDTAYDASVDKSDPQQAGMPVILRITGLTEAQLSAELSALTAADGTRITVTETGDGYLVSPLSAFEAAQACLQAAYPMMGIEIVRAETVPDSYTADAFYIQIDEP